MSAGIVSVTRTRLVPLPAPWWAPWRKGRTMTETAVVGTAEHDMKGKLNVRNMKAHGKRLGCINIDVMDDDAPIITCSIPIQIGDEVRANFRSYPL